MCMHVAMCVPSVCVYPPYVCTDFVLWNSVNGFYKFNCPFFGMGLLYICCNLIVHSTSVA